MTDELPGLERFFSALLFLGFFGEGRVRERMGEREGQVGVGLGEVIEVKIAFIVIRVEQGITWFLGGEGENREHRVLLLLEIEFHLNNVIRGRGMVLYWILMTWGQADILWGIERGEGRDGED